MQLDTASEQRVRCVVLGVPRCVELAATANTWAMCEHLYSPVLRAISAFLVLIPCCAEPASAAENWAKWIQHAAFLYTEAEQRVLFGLDLQRRAEPTAMADTWFACVLARTMYERCREHLLRI